MEFSLVLAPFLMLLFAILEVGSVLLANVELENAVVESARMIRTGQVQAGGMTETEYRNEMCNYLQILLNCGDDLVIDVRSFSNFGNTNPADMFDDDGQIQVAPEFSPGNAGEVVVVRAYYYWDLVLPYIGKAVANGEGGKRILVSSVAFRNEPFQSIVDD